MENPKAPLKPSGGVPEPDKLDKAIEACPVKNPKRYHNSDWSY